MPDVKLKWNDQQSLVPDEATTTGEMMDDDFGATYLLTRQAVHEFHDPAAQNVINAISAQQQAEQEARMTEMDEFRKAQAKKQAQGKEAENTFASGMVDQLMGRSGGMPTEPIPAHAAPATELAPSHVPAGVQAQAQQAANPAIEAPMVDPPQDFGAGFGAKLSLEMGKALVPSLGKLLAKSALTGGVNIIGGTAAGVAADVVGAKVPELALPTAVVLGLFSGRYVEPKFEEIIARGVSKAAAAAGQVLDPATLKAQVPIIRNILESETGAVGRDIAQPAPVWRSQMQDVLAAKLPGRGDPQQMLQTVEAFAKKGEFKPEELEWSGLREWLGQQQGKVSKEDVTNYLRENNVQVKEVVKGGGKYNYQGNEWQQAIDRAEAGGNWDEAERIQRAWEGINEETGSTAGMPVYQQYQTTGGENYRELLLTLPAKDYSKEREAITKQMREAAKSGDDAAFDELSKRKAALVEPESFRSTHYPEKDILAHVRFNERTDADGKKVLFIEEIQSDWHQKGRKEGYQPTEQERVDASNKIKELRVQQQKVFSANNGLTGEQRNREWDRIEQEVKPLAAIASNRKGLVPDAPFKTSWPMLAMKRMVRYAAENGFDRIAWTTGDMQAARYDLSKQVDAIKIVPKNSGHDILAYQGEKEITVKRGASEKEIADYVGKDIAEKYKSDLGSEKSFGFYKGDDLKVGGEGMKGFYDKILPAEVNKFFNKGAWGNAKVGQTAIDVTQLSDMPYQLFERGELVDAFRTKEQANDFLSGLKPAERRRYKVVFEGDIPTKDNVHSLDITPQMKAKAVSEGMPLFGVAGSAAGFEQDEEGNITFDPKKAMAGAAAGMAAMKFAPQVMKYVKEAINSEIANTSVQRVKQVLNQRGEIVIRGGDEPAMPVQPAPVKGAGSGVPEPPEGDVAAVGPNRTGMVKAGQDIQTALKARPDVTTEYAGPGNLRLWGAGLDPKYPEELMPHLVAGAETFAPQTEAARRYVQSWTAGEEKAKQYGLTDLLGRRSGQAFNQEQTINAQDNFVNILAEFKAASDVIAKGGATDIQKAEYMASLNLFYSGMMQMSGIAAEAGRALQVHRRMKQMLGGAKLGELQEFMKGAMRMDPEKIAGFISECDSPAEVAGLIRIANQATTWGMFKEGLVNLLIGPYSQIANGASNTVSSLWMVGEHATAAAVSQIPMLGSKEMQIGEAVQAAYGWVEGWKDGLKLFGRTFVKGTSQFESATGKFEQGASAWGPQITAENVRSKLVGEEGSRNWFQEMVQKTAPHVLEEGGPYAKAMDAFGEFVRAGFGGGGTRLLAAMDDLFKVITYRSQLRARSLRMASQEIASVETAEAYLSKAGVGFDGMDPQKKIHTAIGHRMAEILTDPQTHAPDLNMDAIKMADYATFTNDLNPAGQAAQHLLQKAPPLQLVVPFFKTPFNVNKWAMTRMPLIGQFFPSFWQDMAAGGARRDLAIARTGMGAALAGVAGYLAWNGYVTGGGPTAKDKKLRSNLYNTNWRPYSMTFDGETYQPLKSVAEPLSTMMGWTADMVDIMKSTRSEDPEVQDSVSELATAVALGWAKNALNTTFLSGLSRFISAVDDPDRYGKKYYEGFAGMFAPGSLRDLEKLVSPERKDIQSVMDMYKSKIPGFSESLPRLRNRWGEVIKVDNRFFPNKTQSSPIDDELTALRADLGKPRRDQFFEVGRHRTSIPFELTPQQYEDLLILMNKVELQSTGEPVKKTLTDLIKTPEYKALAPEDKNHKIRRYWNEAIKLGKRELLNKYADLSQRAEADIVQQQAAR